MSHINHAFRDYRVRADKLQLSKCNARIHTGFCVGGGEEDMCGNFDSTSAIFKILYLALN